MKTLQRHTNTITFSVLCLLFSLLFQPSSQYIHYENLAEIDCSESSNQRLCSNLQNLFNQNQYLSSLLQSMTGSSNRFNSGEIDSNDEENAMKEFMEKMKLRQVELSLELSELIGPKQNIQDLCYSQPETFWYCKRLMTNIE